MNAITRSSAGSRNTLTLRANGRDISGWQSIPVTRRMLGCPSDFDIGLTERSPTEAAAILVEPGQACEVLLDGDVVLTGYIDRYAGAISPRQHQVRVVGRSKCEDVVDCHITPTHLVGMQIITSSLLELANRLCAPYGITAKSLTGDNIPVGPPTGAGPLRFNAILTETPFEIIERVARYAGVLVYDDADGNLVFANVGTSNMASGFALGVNVQHAAVTYSMDGRFSEYRPHLMSVNFFGDKGAGGIPYPPVFDKGVPRFRQRIVVSEQPFPGSSMAEKRAQWEAARRLGQSQAVRLTCDSWRDSAGTLWQPNAFAPLDLPALKLSPSDPWVIGEVTYAMDQDRGTTADLMLMPKDAFLPEPTILTPFLSDPDTRPPLAGGGAARTGAEGVGIGGGSLG